jgi:hypothetical protein
MRAIALILFAITTCWQAGAAPKCAEIFALGGMNSIYEDHHCFEMDCWSSESERALPVARAIVAHNPAIAFGRIKVLIAFALENAVQHGRSPRFSDVEISVQKTDAGLRVQILNDRRYQLPATLKDKVFEAGIAPFTVPEAERDRSRGSLGLATGQMISALNQLYIPPTTKIPTVTWREVHSSLTDKPKVLFELYLPD